MSGRRPGRGRPGGGGARPGGRKPRKGPPDVSGAGRAAPPSGADLERAATIWLNAIHEINRTTREAARTAARERRRAADLLASMEKLALDVDAARTTAEGAAAACRGARLAPATREQAGVAPPAAA